MLGAWEWRAANSLHFSEQQPVFLVKEKQDYEISTLLCLPPEFHWKFTLRRQLVVFNLSCFLGNIFNWRKSNARAVLLLDVHGCFHHPDYPLKCIQTLSVPNPLHKLQNKSAVFHLHGITYNMEGCKYGIIVATKCTVSFLWSMPDPQEKKVHSITHILAFPCIHITPQ